MSLASVTSKPAANPVTIQIACVVAVTVAGITSDAGAQGTFCRPLDDYGADFRNQVVLIATEPGEPYKSLRPTLRMPAVSANEITVETRESVCKQAAEAYDREMVKRGNPPRQRKVHVLKVSNLIVVSDPDDRWPGNEWRTSMLFTDKYVYLSAFGT